MPAESIKAMAMKRAGGRSVGSLAAEYGLNHTTVTIKTNEYARANGIHYRSRRSVVSWDRIEEMAKRKATGESLASIADDYGITRERVRQLIKKYEIKHGIKLPRASFTANHTYDVMKKCDGCGKLMKYLPSLPRMFCSRGCRSNYIDKINRPLASKIINRRLDGSIWEDCSEFGTIPSLHRYCYREFRRRLRDGEPVTREQITSVFKWGTKFRKRLLDYLNGVRVPEAMVYRR